MIKEVWECDYCHNKQEFYLMSAQMNPNQNPGDKMYNYCHNGCVDPTQTIKGKSRFTLIEVSGDDGKSLHQYIEEVMG